MTQRLAIVGTRVLACPGDEVRARWRIQQAIEHLMPAVVISGGAQGVDMLAEAVAVELGYSEQAGSLCVYRPLVHRWGGAGGYRDRNRHIAETCTHLLQIGCRQAVTYGSGWTADTAEMRGCIVSRWSPCPPPNG